MHLKGTDFQLKVWETLLKIPMGKLSTYGNIAAQIQSPKASRAVGSAIGDNPVAFLIPCHRVIQSTGIFGGYHWGRHPQDGNDWLGSCAKWPKHNLPVLSIKSGVY